MTIRHQLGIVSLFVIMILLHVVQTSRANGSEVTTPTIRTDTLSDPLFGIVYHPSEIRFESAPNEIYRCRDIEAPRGNLFLFGKVTMGKVHFYYVYGWEEVESQDGIRCFEAESDSGIIVVVSPDGCRNIGAGYAWSTENKQRQEAEKYGITEEITTALLEDVVDQEVRAFGGRAEFLRKLTASGVDESKLPVQVRAKLGVLRDSKTD